MSAKIIGPMAKETHFRERNGTILPAPSRQFPIRDPSMRDDINHLPSTGHMKLISLLQSDAVKINSSTGRSVAGFDKKEDSFDTVQVYLTGYTLDVKIKLSPAIGIGSI